MSRPGASSMFRIAVMPQGIRRLDPHDTDPIQQCVIGVDA